ncbi:MAG: SAM-dependent methyltransferase [Pseudomonadota bacterium]
MWDDRYASDEYLFGTEPNDFLKASAAKLPPGRILCLADGEGRNGVYLAEQGYDVTSIDGSAVALAKARRLADARGVTLTTHQADLFDYDPGEACWDGIVIIFFHMPPDKRRQVHALVERALVPGGVLVHEAYTPEQLNFRTGGPPVAEFLQTVSILRQDFPGLVFEHALELERDVVEGKGHFGRASVVQLIARKPA